MTVNEFDSPNEVIVLGKSTEDTRRLARIIVPRGWVAIPFYKDFESLLETAIERNVEIALIDYDAAHRDDWHLLRSLRAEGWNGKVVLMSNSPQSVTCPDSLSITQIISTDCLADILGSCLLDAID